MHTWTLSDAKARLSEVFRLARSQGPQVINRHAGDEVVMLRREEFETLLGRAKKRPSLVEVFRKSPLYGSDILFERAADLGRAIDL
jgi:prevent-host-death family protein